MMLNGTCAMMIDYLEYVCLTVRYWCAITWNEPRTAPVSNDCNASCWQAAASRWTALTTIASLRSRWCAPTVTLCATALSNQPPPVTRVICMIVLFARSICFKPSLLSITQICFERHWFINNAYSCWWFATQVFNIVEWFKFSSKCDSLYFLKKQKKNKNQFKKIYVGMGRCFSTPNCR